MKKKRVSLEEYMFEMMREMQKEMDEAFRMHGGFDEELFRPGKKVVRGVSIKVGPDGKPVIEEFGSMPTHQGKESKKEMVVQEREPLVDVMEGDKETVVIAEVPGVASQDIKLSGNSREMEIKVEGKERKYYKKISFGKAVDFGKKKVNYRNGVLEVRIPVK